MNTNTHTQYSIKVKENDGTEYKMYVTGHRKAYDVLFKLNRRRDIRNTEIEVVKNRMN